MRAGTKEKKSKNDGRNARKLESSAPYGLQRFVPVRMVES